MRITFFGPPGSGKGTQAHRISVRYDLKHLSTGLMFREEISSCSELGRRIKGIVEAGHLVDDETVNLEVFSKIEGVGHFLLDGYPRNRDQAESLDAFLRHRELPLTAAVFIDVPDEEVQRRLSGRLTCPRCGFVGTRPMFEENDSCSRCGTPLEERDDDRTEVIARRLRHYHNLTSPLESYYTGRLLAVDGTGTVDQVTHRLEEVLDPWA